MEAPIIFIHYGNTNYFKYTLKSAKIFNPDKRVIIIGDKENEFYSRKYNLEHYYFDDYLESEEIRDLNNAYKIIGGVDFKRMNDSKGGEDWTKFNFIKWGVLYNFIKSENIDRLWTFDSDTLILTDLKQKEIIYDGYDYTVINSNNTMQGLINNVEFLKKFVLLAKDLLSNNSYLEELLKTDFKVNPMWGFTMMRVFKELSVRAKPKIIHLDKSINGEYFDECVCVGSSKETNDYFIANQKLKKIYFDKKGNLYNYDLIKKKYFLVWGINLSWVPDYVFLTLYNISKNKLRSKNIKQNNSQKNIRFVVNYKIPITIMVKNVLSHVCKRFKCSPLIHFIRNIRT